MLFNESNADVWVDGSDSNNLNANLSTYFPVIKIHKIAYHFVVYTNTYSGFSCSVKMHLLLCMAL